MDHEEEILDGLSITLEDSLDLKERFESTIHLVGRLIADNEPSYIMVKEVLRSAWNKLGIVRISKAKDNIYAITIGEEAVVKKLLEGNPWFIRAIYWVQVHGILITFCTLKNARCLGSKIGEWKTPWKLGFVAFSG
ncbi:hypothetical protein D8674_021947 [Pyrus ussuriensis x Pyrus communis]|uniref:DUF4283 domain-containing protein n=1 Tax=Pyrus ussuriensis x Pyrus communis TaxID=2448454 RepID=A0A5N5GIL0_9ROSA|nr:hypothetical protein D8674_040636 [Pyrus ussuriensis x Pyrus communis]KAB2615359.1 hypothetical protein D8674_021947 [Pyrus ussuriensis x Pyrus communis]